MSTLGAWGLFIGRDWFERRGLAARAEVPGMVDRLEDLAEPASPVARVHPDIRDFYERTQDHEPLVRARWRPALRRVGHFYVNLARRMGQLVLPLESAELQGVTCSLKGLDQSADGRAGVRAYVRCYQDERPMYVAAYAVHTHGGVGYMNIALPVPGGNLSSVLRMQIREHEGGRQLGIVLTSQRKADMSDDTGIWFVTRLLPIRMPISETLDVWTPDDMPGGPMTDGDAPRGTTVLARHRLSLCGIEFLTMDYFIRRVADLNGRRRPPGAPPTA